jgi:multisubunit Na+/H+ antiporter MnhB subunit
MKNPEKAFVTIVAIAASVALFATAMYSRTDDGASSLAKAIAFIPYYLGPCLISAYRPRTTRLRFYVISTFVALSPLSNLFFIVSLVIACSPQSEPSAAVDYAAKERSLERISSVIFGILVTYVALIVAAWHFIPDKIKPVVYELTDYRKLEGHHSQFLRVLHYMAFSAWPVFVFPLICIAVWMVVEIKLRKVREIPRHNLK